MKIVHISGSISRRAGGFFNSVRRLAQQELSCGCEVKVMGGRDEFTHEDMEYWGSLRPRIYPVCGPLSIGYSNAIAPFLKDWDPDLVHLHGLWQYLSPAASKWARANGARYVISPRGMLDPWALKNSAWKKRLAGVLFQKRDLQNASCIHALTEKEAEDVRGYGIRSPVCVVPNGVDLPEHRAAIKRREAREKQLLYIGRLHPKKNLKNLLCGWQIARRQESSAVNWRLVIAGWDDGEYEAELKQLVIGLGLEGCVSFPGSIYGEEKDAMFRSSDAFVHPSLSEGLPMSVLEAWAYGLPVLMSKECNLTQGISLGAALDSGTHDASIASSLGQLMNMSPESRRKMGLRGREIVEKDYSWEKQAEIMILVYRWLLGKGDRPNCII